MHNAATCLTCCAARARRRANLLADFLGLATAAGGILACYLLAELLRPLS